MLAEQETNIIGGAISINCHGIKVGCIGLGELNLKEVDVGHKNVEGKRGGTLWKRFKGLAIH